MRDICRVNAGEFNLEQCLTTMRSILVRDFPDRELAVGVNVYALHDSFVMARDTDATFERYEAFR